MSDLQIGLILLGLGCVALVVIYNLVQERRARRLVQPKAPSDDPLLKPLDMTETSPTGRQEPVLLFDDAEPAGSSEPPAEATNAADMSEQAEVGPDEFCDAVFEIQFAEPVKGSDLQPFVSVIRQIGHKPVTPYGITADGAVHAVLQGSQRYAAVHLAVLLANRSGPLTDDELNQAVAHARVLADRFDGSVECPPAASMLERANRIDAVCASLDQQVGVNLLALGQPWGIDEIRKAAVAAGFEGPLAGRYLWITPEGLTGFTLLRPDGRPIDSPLGSPVGQLALVLDVPCAPQHASPFRRMVDVARRMAPALQARLVDDAGREIGLGTEDPVDEQIRQLQQRLAQAGLEAGSARARRLFS